MVANPIPVKLHQATSLRLEAARFSDVRSTTTLQPPISFMAIKPTSSKPKIMTEQCTILARAVPFNPPNTVKEIIKKAPMATPSGKGIPVKPETMAPMM